MCALVYVMFGFIWQNLENLCLKQAFAYHSVLFYIKTDVFLGFGVFATVDFKKGDFLMEYRGK